MPLKLIDRSAVLPPVAVKFAAPLLPVTFNCFVYALERSTVVESLVGAICVIAEAFKTIESAWVKEPPLVVAVTLIVDRESPREPASGLPEIVAVPSWLSVRVSPGGKEPVVMPMVGAGNPVVVTLKLYGVPTVPAGGAALDTDGAEPTFTVIVCWAFGVTPFAAVTTIGKAPTCVDEPEIVAVPFPLSLKPMPVGRGPDRKSG